MLLCASDEPHVTVETERLTDQQTRAVLRGLHTILRQALPLSHVVILSGRLERVLGRLNLTTMHDILSFPIYKWRRISMFGPRIWAELQHIATEMDGTLPDWETLPKSKHTHKHGYFST